MLANCRQSSRSFLGSATGRPAARVRRVPIGLALSALATLGSGCFPWQAPPEIQTARTLEEARRQAETLEFAQLSTAPLDAFPAELARFPKLWKLSLRGQKTLSPLPELLGDFRHLRWLDLADMELRTLPAGLAALPLEHLYLSDNRFVVLPDSLGALEQLTYLNLDRNALTTLPPSVGGLTSLRWIRLNNNQLSDLPDELSAWGSIRRIYLQQNRFETVPEVLFELHTLEHLNLGANPITELPQAIRQLRRLERLDLNHTAIATLPETLAELRELRQLVLTGSPIPAAERSRWRAALPNCHIEF